MEKSDCKYVEIIKNGYFNARYCKLKKKYCVTVVPVATKQDAINYGCFGEYERKEE